MKILRLTWFHLKRILFNNWGYVLFTLGFPLIIIFFFLTIMQDDSSVFSQQSIAVLNHSDYVQEEVVPHMSENYQAYFTDDAAEAFGQMDQLEVTMIYEIPEDFPSAEQQITVHSLSGENRDALFETELFQVIAELKTNEAFSQANISFASTEVADATWIKPTENFNSNIAFIIFMLLFFMGYATGFIAGDLAKMRKEGLLTRSIVSNTYSWQILGSVLLAYIIYELLVNIVIIGIMSAIFDVPIHNPMLVVSLILSMSIFTVGLTMVLFRLLKNEVLIQMLGLMFIIILVFIPLFAETFTAVHYLQFLSPYYWVFEAIDTGLILPNALVIALYGVVLFTAGSFKVERLVNA